MTQQVPPSLTGAGPSQSSSLGPLWRATTALLSTYAAASRRGRVGREPDARGDLEPYRGSVSGLPRGSLPMPGAAWRGLRMGDSYECGSSTHIGGRATPIREVPDPETTAPNTPAPLIPWVSTCPWAGLGCNDLCRLPKRRPSVGQAVNGGSRGSDAEEGRSPQKSLYPYGLARYCPRPLLGRHLGLTRYTTPLRSPCQGKSETPPSH